MGVHQQFFQLFQVIEICIIKYCLNICFQSPTSKLVVVEEFNEISKSHLSYFSPCAVFSYSQSFTILLIIDHVPSYPKPQWYFTGLLSLTMPLALNLLLYSQNLSTLYSILAQLSASCNIRNRSDNKQLRCAQEERAMNSKSENWNPHPSCPIYLCKQPLFVEH